MKSYVFGQFAMQLVEIMFITNNLAFFHLRCKENLVKHHKISKYYDHDCLQNVLLVFMSLLTVIFLLDITLSF